MNPVKVCGPLRELVEKHVKCSHPEHGKGYLIHMLHIIEAGVIKNDRAQRWIGFVEGVLSTVGVEQEEVRKLHKGG